MGCEASGGDVLCEAGSARAVNGAIGRRLLEFAGCGVLAQSLGGGVSMGMEVTGEITCMTWRFRKIHLWETGTRTLSISWGMPVYFQSLRGHVLTTSGRCQPSITTVFTV